MNISIFFLFILINLHLKKILCAFVDNEFIKEKLLEIITIELE